MAKKKVFIIGAGPAGLTAGYELLAKSGGGNRDFELVIFEKSAEVGGMSKTFEYDNFRASACGRWCAQRDSRDLEWILKFMPLQGRPAFDDILLDSNKKFPKGGPDPQREDMVTLLRSGISRIYMSGVFWDYPLKANSRTLDLFGPFEAAKILLSGVKAGIFRRNEFSLEDYYINRAGRFLYGKFYEEYLEKVYGVRPSEILPEFATGEFRGLPEPRSYKEKAPELLTADPDKSGPKDIPVEEFYYPKYGPGRLWNTDRKSVV
jgi:protoporphyrinogen oxidase